MTFKNENLIVSDLKFLCFFKAVRGAAAHLLVTHKSQLEELAKNLTEVF